MALINAAGLGAQALARRIEGYPPGKVPPLVLAKGNYFAYAGRPVFSRLVYPTPVDGGLGVHVTIDLAGRMRFGPDVEWIDHESYTVDPRRADAFYARIRGYWPGLPDGTLVPDYCGVRPKLTGPGEPPADFMIAAEAGARHAALDQFVRYRVAGPDLFAVAGGRGRRLSCGLIGRGILAQHRQRHRRLGGLQRRNLTRDNDARLVVGRRRFGRALAQA